MGFFSDLKEDLNQAVTELNPEAGEATADTKEEETKLDMAALLDNIDESVAKVNETPVALKPAPKFSDEVATITAGMDITGDITSGGSVDLMGNVKGNITISGKLNILGSVQGDSKASEIYAENAKIEGEVNSTGSVKVGQSTVIIGNIFATSAVIAGAVKGDIDVKGPVVLDTSAIVMGNIKSKSVQINNGAVIEGICSQCYADVSPTSFFDEFKKNKK